MERRSEHELVFRGPVEGPMRLVVAYMPFAGLSEAGYSAPRVAGTTGFDPGGGVAEPRSASVAGVADLGSGPLRVAKPGTYGSIRAQAAAHWRTYWNSGAVVDFSGSSDPRAAELERRVVLSQYLTAIQFAGPVPPAETGLTCSSWYGKHNSEMVWWHEAHFALWGRPEYVANVLAWFDRTLPHARATAAERGLPGARWSKMAGPAGRESPGGNAFIVWNQPNPIYLAELLYRDDPRPEVLRRWRAVVLETADCMAAMLQRGADSRYHLGPPQPGIPKNGRWKVRAEGLRPLP